MAWHLDPAVGGVVVERIWHTQDSQGQVLALAFRLKCVPYSMESGRAWYLDPAVRRVEAAAEDRHTLLSQSAGPATHKTLSQSAGPATHKTVTGRAGYLDPAVRRVEAAAEDRHEREAVPGARNLVVHQNVHLRPGDQVDG